MNKLTPLYLSLGVVVGSVLTFVLFTCLPKPQIMVTGTVLLQEGQARHITGTYPEGYYLACDAVERVYLSHDTIEKYHGRAIWAKGHLRTISGPDGSRVLPSLMITRLAEAGAPPK